MGAGAHPQPVCRGLAGCWPSWDPPCMGEGVNCSVMFQTHLKVWSAQEPTMFSLCFQKACWTKAPGCCFVYILPPALPSLKVESPLPDQREQLSGAGRRLSTSSPQLSLSLQSAARCQIYSLLCEHSHKNQQSSPTPWLSFCPDPLTHS